MSPLDAVACAEGSLTLHGFLDGELDAIHSLRFEQHLASCPRCAAEAAKFLALTRIVAQDGVRWRAPNHIHAQILDAVAGENAGRRSVTAAERPGASRLLQFISRWSLIPSMAALAASLFLVLAAPHDGASVQDEVVASHVRSLLVDHLTDVKSSDRHTVKPWFNGKIDFSPPIVDLSSEGFPLIGGRVDYVGGRVVAALVYRRHGHIINVFVWPGPTLAPAANARDGYNLVGWSNGGLRFSAISDLNATEILGFRDLFSRSIEDRPLSP